VPPPSALQDGSWSPFFERRSVPTHQLPTGETARCAWARIVGELPDDPLLHACALAYISDDLPTEAVMARHPEPRRDPSMQFWNASLDHTIWFHDTVRADLHHLYQFDCHALRSGRALAIGNVFDATGKHLATVDQEVLLRKRRS
jgi:acyl-CoA thioesterase II